MHGFFTWRFRLEIKAQQFKAAESLGDKKMEQQMKIIDQVTSSLYGEALQHSIVFMIC